MAAALAATTDFSRYSKPPPLGGGVFTAYLNATMAKLFTWTYGRKPLSV